MAFLLRHARPLLQAVKPTTGLVGIDVIPEGRAVFVGICKEVLESVKAIPPEAGYRKTVEATYTHRLSVAESTEEVADIESKIASGQIEELVIQAKDELSIIPKMAEWKPWEFSHEIDVKEEGGDPSTKEVEA